MRSGLSGWDKTIVFYGVNSNSDVATVADLAVIGNGWLAGTQLFWPLPSTAALYHNVILGATWKHFDEVIGFNDPGQEDIETPIDYLELVGGLQRDDRRRQPHPGRQSRDQLRRPRARQ